MSIFVHIEGIEGEVSDSLHKDWLDILSVSLGVNREITSNTSTRGDRESSNAAMSELTIKRFMDKATPRLHIEACCGRGKTVTIHQTKTGAGTGADVFIQYTLHNAIVCEYKMAAWAQDTDRPIEKIKISFTKLEIRYTPYDDNGMAASPLSVAFDTATNTKA